MGYEIPRATLNRWLECFWVTIIPLDHVRMLLVIWGGSEDSVTRKLYYVCCICRLMKDETMSRESAGFHWNVVADRLSWAFSMRRLPMSDLCEVVLFFGTLIETVKGRVVSPADIHSPWVIAAWLLVSYGRTTPS